MAGEFGADNFFVYDIDKGLVAAKFLKNANGEYVIDQLTLKPYIVPADYDPAAVIARFSSEAAYLWTATTGTNLLPGLGTEAHIAAYRIALYEYFTYQFLPGHTSDVQRCYNGLKNASAVPDFINAASYSLGLATFAAGLPKIDSQLGGGALNIGTFVLHKLFELPIINIEGAFYNGKSVGHDNAQEIAFGYLAAQDNIFTGTTTSSTSTGSSGFTLSPDGATMIFPDGSASTRLINRDGTSTVSTASQNGNTSVINYDKVGNVISESIRTVNGDGTYTLSNADAKGSANSTTYNLSDDSIVNNTVITADRTKSYTSYSVNHNLSNATVTHIDGSGSITNYSGTGNKLHEKITNSDGSTTTKDYYANGNLQAATTNNADGSGSIESYDPYGAGSKKTINADGSFTNTGYFAGGAVSSVNVVNADGSNSSTVYSPGGSVYSEISSNVDGSGSNSRKDFGYPDTMVSNADGSATFYYGGGVWTMNADGSGNSKSYDPVTGVTGASYTITVNADGTWTEEATDGAGWTSTEICTGYGSYTSVTHFADGTYAVAVGNGDGSVTISGNNGSNYGPTVIPGTPLSNPQTTTDPNGTVTTTSRYADGYVSEQTITNPDGSVVRTSFYPFGQDYGWDVRGFPSSRVITYHDGSSESTRYYANGVASEDLYTNADGSRYTSHRYSNGNLSSEENTSATGSDIKHYYADGTLSNETITRSDGSSDSRSYYVDGLTISSETITNADGTGSHTTHYADGVVSYKSITNADGSHSATSYYGNGLPKAATYSNTDGTSGSINYYINGNVSSNETHFSNGSVTKASFAFDGTQQSDSWSNFDGTSGSDTFKADGSSSGKVYAVDHSYYGYTNDGIGGITTTNYAANNVKLSDSWIADNGTIGSDIFYTDGSYTSTTYASNGSIATQSVTFAQGVMPADLQLSWGQTIGSISGLATDPQLNYTTLNLSWGAGSQSIQVMVPHTGDPLGSSMSGFTFADGTTLSLAQMTALAPAAPTFDPQIFQYQQGMGVQVLGTGYSSINFGPGITSNMVTLGLGSLMLRVGNNGDVIHIENFDPSNALAANSIQNFNFADGTSLSYDQLLARGFDIYGTIGNETLSGTNLDNRIYAGSGNDTLIGTGANDTLVAGSGVDTLIGGTGNETFVVNNSDDVIVANSNAASNSIISSVSYVLPANVVQNLTLTGSDNLSATGNNLDNVITANAGNDTLVGGGGNDTLIAGSGNDQIFAGSGAAIIKIDPTTVRTDLIGGIGVDPNQFLDKFYQSMGINNWQMRYQYGAPGMYYLSMPDAGFGAFNEQGVMDHFQGWGVTFQDVLANGWVTPLDPLPVLVEVNGSSIQPSAYYASANVPVVNVLANDYQALAPYFADGVLPQHTVSFGAGVLPSDVRLSWGETVGSMSGLPTDLQSTHTTLNISWGVNNQSIRVMIPHSDDPLGSGTSQFTFTNPDGSTSTLSMADMIAMAPAAPTFDLQIFQYQPGMGVQYLGAGYKGISFGPGITSSMVTLGLGSLMLRIGNNGDVIHITNFDPSNALAANSIQQFNFADGTSLTYDQLLARGFDIYSSTGDQVLSGTNLDNRIYGGSGNDTLIGTGANDTLVAGVGVDTMIGGLGNEIFVINNAADVIVADANAASNSIISSVSYVMPDNVQNLTLTGNGNLTATGNSLNDIITGNAGNDTLIAGGGNDTLVAGTGGGTMISGTGYDTFVLNPGSGQQTIIHDPQSYSLGCIQFGAGITAGNVQFFQKGADLLVKYGAQGDSVLIKNITPWDNLPNAQVVNLYKFADGSHGSYVTDKMGNAHLYAYNYGGQLVGDFWQKGTSYGNDTFNADGSSSGTAYKTDGSYSSYINDGLGDVTTNYYDASGSLLGFSTSVSNGSGNVTTTNFDPNGAMLGYSFLVSDGLGNGTKTNYDANGIVLGYSTISNNGLTTTTQNYDANNQLLSYSTYVKSAYDNGITTNFDSNGIKLSETLVFLSGSVTTSYYDTNGNVISDIWTGYDGSHGTDTFNTDGSSYGTSYNADGSYYTYTQDAQGNYYELDYAANSSLTGSYTQTYDGMGNSSWTNYDANGNKLNDGWNRVDGTYGNDTFNADGTSSGTSYNADGSYSSYTNDGHGDVTTQYFDANSNLLNYSTLIGDGHGNGTTTNYDANGNLLSSIVSTNDGVGDTTTTTYDPNGSYQQSTAKGDGSTTTTNYNAATGEVIGSVATAGAGYSYTYDNTVNVNGVAGETESKVAYTYTDGSTYSTDTVYDPNGSYQQSTAKGDGSTTTTNYNAATGEVIGSVATAGAGYSYTYDNTVNVNGVAGETESKVAYTYADGSTYGTDTVYDPNGSYQQSTAKGDGSTTTTNYNATNGEVIGSVATTGAGYSYTYDNTVNVNGVAGETESKVSYTYADGSTYGTDTVYDPNGSYQQSTVKGDGSTTSTNYNAATGEVIGSVATAGAGYSYTYDNTVNVNGVAGETESKVNYTYADGSTYGTDTVYDPNGSYQQSTAKGDGSTTTTNYNSATGEVIGSVATAGAGYSYTYDNTVNVNGVSGETESKVAYTYADGSTYGTDTVYGPNGSYQQSTAKGDGSTTTTNYNATTGEVIGSVATAGAGYSYTYDNTVNVNGVSGETESKVAYTYADGSTYSTDTVYDPNGSYQQSTAKGDGSTTATNYNAATGEVIGSVATAGAGYSYTYDNTVNVNGVSGETESKVNYTYADGSTYNTDTVSNPDSSYFQSWNKSDGTSGSAAVNANGTLAGDSWVHADGNQGVDAAGNHLIMSGSASDTLTVASGNDILIGGAGNDTLTTGSGTNLIAFNQGDGQDIVNAAAGQNNTLSLGGHFAFTDLALQKNGNDLVLDVGTADSITFKNWYAGAQNIVNLQVIASAMTDFNHGSTDILRNSNVENFDFQSLVAAFDQAQAANPSLNAWGVTNDLLNAHLASSDTAALGGDLAYVYGTQGSLTGMNVAAAENTLSNTQFAAAPQTLNPWPTLNTGTAQIR